MKEAVLYTLLGALTVACLGQGYYIYTHRKSSAPAPHGAWPARTEKLNQNVQRSISRGEALPPAVFDDFFNDEFFGRRLDPFAEMERIHRQMADMFRSSERAMLDSSWNSWFNERMGMDEFRAKVSRTDKNVVLSFDIPGIDGNTADININDDRIRISFTARDVQDKNDGKGAVRRESTRSYMKILPVPEDAVPSSAKTSIDKDRVTITFDKKPGK